MDREKFLIARVKKIFAVALTAALISIGGAAHASPDNDRIQVIPGSKINLVSRWSNIPVQISNTFDAEITVLVHARPLNNRVIVYSVKEKLPPLTTQTVQLPVEAVANGPVSLQVWVETFSGIRLGKAKYLNMDVNADVEFVFVAGLIAIVAVLLVLGTIRTLRRRQIASNQ